MSAPSTSLRYAAFISYSHADEAEAGRLHRALENFRVPQGVVAPAGMPASRGRIAPVFRDREELSSSPDLSAVIREALAAASALIVLCSPKAKASRWVNEEIKTFKRLHGEGRVYAFLLEGEPADSFPPALLRKLGPDGELSEEEGEPLAADIRPGKDGWKLGVLKIAAGLLDVGLDSLRQREQQRERRRLLAVTGLSTAVAAGALGLASWALHASSIATRERARAEREALTAQRISGFMVNLFELADRGEAKGEEVKARDILDRGVSRIESDLVDEPAVQGDLMFAMGRARTGLGLFGDAAEILEKAADRQRAAGAPPLDVFATENALAIAHYEKGEFDKAGAVFERLIAETPKLIEAVGWKPVMADVLTGMGDIQYRKDDYAAAERFYAEAYKQLNAAKEPDAMLAARAAQGLAGALYLQDRNDEAKAWFETARKLYERARGPDYYKIGWIENDLAGLLYFEKDLEGAASHFRTALDINSRNLGPDHVEVVGTMNNLARIDYELGDIEQARAMLADAIEAQRRSDRARHVDFAFFLNTMGEIQNDLGKPAEALRSLDEALALVKSSDHRLYGPILMNLGRAKCALKEAGAGLASIADARAAMPAHYPSGNWRHAAADEFEARCRLAAGDRAEARRLAAKALTDFKAALGDRHHFTKRAAALAASL
jgi:tetratricopeptide (TPR) repeat protein